MLFYQSMMEWLSRVRKAMSSAWAYKLVRWGIGVIFLYAGAFKLVDPQTFAVLIDSYGLVADRWVMPLAVGLPAVEVAAGIGLLFDARGALSVITGLLLLFVAVLGYGLWLGLDIDCGCFRTGDPEARAFHGLRAAFYRDIILIGGVFYLYWWRLRRSFVPMRL